MWDMLRLSAIGKLIGSKIAVFIIAIFMAVSLVATVPTATVFAVDATWAGDTISYNDTSYDKQDLALPGTDSGSQVFVSTADKTKIIIIPGGADTTQEIANAQHATYVVDANGNYSSQSGSSQISVSARDAPSGGNTSGVNTNGNQSGTSCAVSGIGWIVCSLSRFLADAMDKAYGWIAEFLTIKPLTTDTESGLFQSWNIARGLANACFIIAFLLIIYAQITSYGMSNYDIKKMIPRLIIAAVAVNVSYYICAAAVDVSNILGDSIAKAFIDIRESLPSPIPQMSWSNMTTYILSAGTIGAAYFGVAAAGGIMALVPLLVPILVGGILSILVAVMVLAARQAIVIVLVVLAPLAFVAYLLPNTESLFSKWRGIFMNMLMIFPLFSLLFGGAQLASSIIIQSTDKISVALLAMFVQVAPLMITPFLMKFSHSLLTQIGGLVNNPNRGLIDRSRNWANERSELARNRQNARGAQRPAFTPSGISYRLSRGKAYRQSRLKLYQDQTAAAIANEEPMQRLMGSTKLAEQRKNAGEAVADRMYEERKAADTREGRSARRDTGVMRTAQMQAKVYQANEDASWEEMLSKNMQHGNMFAGHARDARYAHEYQQIAESRTSVAKALQKSEYAESLIKSSDLQKAAGGIDVHGADRVLAEAVNEYRSDYGKRVAAAAANLKHYNLSSTQRQDLALGKDVFVDDGNGSLKVFRKDNIFAREAAIEQQLATGTYKEIEQIVMRSGSELKDFKTTIGSAIADNKLSGKAVFLGGKTIDDAGQGRITSMDDLMQAVTGTIANGKISMHDLATNDSEALKRIFAAASARSTTGLTPEQIANLDASIAELKAKAFEVISNPNVGRDLKGNSRDVLDQISKL